MSSNSRGRRAASNDALAVGVLLVVLLRRRGRDMRRRAASLSPEIRWPAEEEEEEEEEEVEGRAGIKTWPAIVCHRAGPEQHVRRDEWEKELMGFIDRADSFYLMWSENAARSRWVEKEARYAGYLYDKSVPHRPQLRRSCCTGRRRTRPFTCASFISIPVGCPSARRKSFLCSTRKENGGRSCWASGRKSPKAEHGASLPVVAALEAADFVCQD